MKPSYSLFGAMSGSLAAALVLALSAPCYGQARFVEPEKIPAVLKPFIGAKEKAIEIKAADLNGDGIEDYVLVTEAPPKSKDEDDQRTLKILIGQPDRSFKLAKANDKVILCSACGGVFGDPFVGVTVEKNSFTIDHYGGSAWRWANTYKFNYSRIDQTWQLVMAKDVSFHSVEPGKRKVKTYKPPKDFGKIDIADFDPGSFLKQQSR